MTHNDPSTHSSNGVNFLNKLFYEKARPELLGKLPNLFVTLELFHKALFGKITKLVNEDLIRVKELASGTRLGIWESFIQLNKTRKWHIVLTDFDQNILPGTSNLISGYFKFQSEALDLFEDIKLLNVKKRFNIIFSAYTFDNIWSSYDIHLTKKGDKWLKSEIVLVYQEAALKMIEKGESLDKSFFESVKVKIRKSSVSLSEIKHGNLISEYYSDQETAEFNYPGGLIDKTKLFFDRQLTKNGVFITADIASTSKADPINTYTIVEDSIMIKIEDYGLAKYILRHLGYQVELKSLYDFIKDEGVATPVKVHDHFVLIISK